MKILLPFTGRAKHITNLGQWDLGDSSYYLEQRIADMIKEEYLQFMTENTRKILEYSVTWKGDIRDNEEVLQLLGTCWCDIIKIAGINNFMHKSEEREVSNRPTPDNYRIWDVDSLRVEGKPGFLLRRTDSGIDARDLQKWLTDVLYTKRNRLIFKPHWNVFNIINRATGTSKSVKWQPLGPSLASFREKVRFLFDTKSVTVDLCIEDGFNTFGLDTHTTEEEWQVDIYDWFKSSNLTVYTVSALEHARG